MGFIIVILALAALIGLPIFLGYLIALFTYKRLVKAGVKHAWNYRIVVFCVSFALLFVAILFLLANSFSFDR